MDKRILEHNEIVHLLQILQHKKEEELEENAKKGNKWSFDRIQLCFLPLYICPR